MRGDEPGWNANAEKLRCHVILDDRYARLVSSRAGDAYFRAFIVEDRTTGDMRMMFRFRYSDPDERDWLSIGTEKLGADAIEFLRHAITKVIRDAFQMMTGAELPDDAIKSFFPPEDNGDPGATLIWLDMQDLIEIVKVEAEH